MAALSNTVDSGSGASGNYASLNALEAAQEQDLTDGGGDTYTAICTTTGDNAADTTLTQFAEWNTSAANYIDITAAAGDVAVKEELDATRYRLIVNDPVTASIQITEANVRVTNLQVSMSYSSDAGQHAIEISSIPAGASDFKISGCRIGADTNVASNSDGIYIADADADVSIWNCIIENGDRRGIYIAAGGTINIYNTVIYGWGGGIYGGGTSSVTVRNCAVFKTGDDFADATSGTWDIDYCALDDADAQNNPVAGNEADADWTTDFNGAATGDFAILTGSPLKDGGVNDPGSGLFSVDIDGDTYVIDSWPVGVDQFMAIGGAALSLPIAMAYYSRIRRTSGD